MIEHRTPSGRIFFAIATLVSSSLAVGCGSSSSLVTPSGPSPLGVTSTITGRVTESAPTTLTGIAGATVTVKDGPTTGPSAVTDSLGFYSITGLKTGRITMSVTADRYVGVAEPLNVTADTTSNFELMPEPETKAFTFTGEIDGTVGTCRDGAAMTPCLIYVFPVHNAGTLDATLRWTPDPDAELDLALFQTPVAAPIARSTSSAEGLRRVEADLSLGAVYELHVTYLPRGTTGIRYTLSGSQPN